MQTDKNGFQVYETPEKIQVLQELVELFNKARSYGLLEELREYAYQYNMKNGIDDADSAIRKLLNKLEEETK